MYKKLLELRNFWLMYEKLLELRIRNFGLMYEKLLELKIRRCKKQIKSY